LCRRARVSRYARTVHSCDAPRSGEIRSALG
jgi:hypothetical protein